jgi:small subunit ribosomal protein S8
MVNDPVGDFIVRLKNAADVNLATVAVPYSNLKHAVADVLKQAGFLSDVVKHGKTVKKQLIVTIGKHADGTPRIQGVKRISKPGRRMYVSAKNINPIRFGKGILVVSTPKGVMSGSTAKKENLGGEAMFELF